MKVTIRPFVNTAKRGGPALPHGGNVGERLKGGAEGGEDGGMGEG
jgi:hypothetical protein